MSDRIDRALPAGWNAVIGAIALIGAVGSVGGSRKDRHVHVLPRDIVDRRVTRFAQRQGVLRVRNDPARQQNHHAVGIGLDGDGMIRPWKLDRLGRCCDRLVHGVTF
jgi:hypothetical protein